MPFLIDGYNLLYAMGVLRDRLGPHGLEQARRRLLGFLRGGHAATDIVTVVFDASRAPPGAHEVQDYQGIHVRFAVHQQEADELIEELIRHDAAPKQLTVVSDDHRIQQAAERRRCIVLNCAAYLDWLERHRHTRAPPPSERTAKPENLSAAERERWLREFADLNDDPQMKELFEPFDFGSDEP
jgi:hypothetical protein